MQKKDCLTQITEAIKVGDVDRAVSLWFDSYQYISPQEFVRCSCGGGWNRNEILEILENKKFMYDQAIAHVEKTVYYSEDNETTY